jgi:putative transposase
VSAYRFIAAQRANHPISLMCRVLGVSRSGYHAWARRPPSTRAVADAALALRIGAIHAESRATYGAPRIHAELAFSGIRVGRKRVARLMRQAGLQGAHRRRHLATTVRDPRARPGPDLVQRDFAAPAPDRLWVADITHLRTWGGWLYLAVVMDACSRAVVGWAMRADLRAGLVVGALQMALARRRPAGGLVHHSDQGTQYTSLAFGRALRRAGIACSMGSVGDCYDNALVESFFATLECELLWRAPFVNRDQARRAVFDFIECFYNPTRRHSSLGYLSPAAFEAALQTNPTGPAGRPTSSGRLSEGAPALVGEPSSDGIAVEA